RRARASPPRSARARRSTCRCSSTWATSSRSTRARASTSSASRAPDATLMDERARLAGRRAALEARSRVVRAARAWFEAEGFLEVETPARVRAPGQEIHLDAIASADRWLVTSPEYHMKRLLGAGFERIVQIGKAWRAGEVGAHHEPEF